MRGRDAVAQVGLRGGPARPGRARSGPVGKAGSGESPTGVLHKSQSETRRVHRPAALATGMIPCRQNRRPSVAAPPDRRAPGVGITRSPRRTGTGRKAARRPGRQTRHSIGATSRPGHVRLCFQGDAKDCLVRSRRLELPRELPHSDLNAARLPIPPRPRAPDSCAGVAKPPDLVKRFFGHAARGISPRIMPRCSTRSPRQAGGSAACNVQRLSQISTSPRRHS